MDRTAHIVEKPAGISKLYAAKEHALKLYRAGCLDEARGLILSLFSHADTDDDRMMLFVNWAIIERGMGHLSEAHSIYKWAAPLADNAEVSHYQKGNFYCGLGINHEEQGNPDLALKVYPMAKFHYEKAEAYRYLCSVENNTALILAKQGKAMEAITSLLETRARLEDRGAWAAVAQVDDTIAQAYLALDDPENGFEYAARSVSALCLMPEEAQALKVSLATRQRAVEMLRRKGAA